MTWVFAEAEIKTGDTDKQYKTKRGFNPNLASG